LRDGGGAARLAGCVRRAAMLVASGVWRGGAGGRYDSVSVSRADRTPGRLAGRQTRNHTFFRAAGKGMISGFRCQKVLPVDRALRYLLALLLCCWSQRRGLEVAYDSGFAHLTFTVPDVAECASAQLGWQCRRHVGDKAKCRLFSCRQGKFGDMDSCVLAHFCVAISRH